jgi:hypothetical protein
MKITIQRLVPLIALSFTALTQAACPPLELRSDTIEPATLPAEVRADYDVFAERCSKCHSLARPLNSGIVDDDYWVMYVARMRRQPSSGISIEDSRVILRFLHYYSLDQIRKKGAKSSSLAPPLPAPLPTDAGASDAG